MILKKRKRISGQSKVEYDLEVVREHMSQVQSLMKIFNYYFYRLE